jgi:hypothetical protein
LLNLSFAIAILALTVIMPIVLIIRHNFVPVSCQQSLSAVSNPCQLSAIPVSCQQSLTAVSNPCQLFYIVQFWGFSVTFIEILKLCLISGFGLGVYEFCVLLGLSAVENCNLGTIYQSLFKGQGVILTLEMGLIFCLEISARNYHSSPV